MPYFATPMPKTILSVLLLLPIFVVSGYAATPTSGLAPPLQYTPCTTDKDCPGSTLCDIEFVACSGNVLASECVVKACVSLQKPAKKREEPGAKLSNPNLR